MLSAHLTGGLAQACETAKCEAARVRSKLESQLKAMHAARAAELDSLELDAQRSSLGERQSSTGANATNQLPDRQAARDLALSEQRGLGLQEEVFALRDQVRYHSVADRRHAVNHLLECQLV